MDKEKEGRVGKKETENKDIKIMLQEEKERVLNVDGKERWMERKVTEPRSKKDHFHPEELESAFLPTDYIPSFDLYDLSMTLRIMANKDGAYCK